MKTLFAVTAFALLAGARVSGQEIITGHVIDHDTKEPLAGATVICCAGQKGTTTNSSGYFELAPPTYAGGDTLVVSYIGYDKQIIPNPATRVVISLSVSANTLQQIMVTANREAVLRTDAPVAISKLSPLVINDTKPVLMAELINKVPGVVMLNYNNEQHAMSIRQPMGTSPYFLYLEDGLPMRPMGVFNHNTLIEMNLFSVSHIEVIKGPASSLYGPEAVGGAINFITHRATVMPTAKVGLQADHWGYKRIQYAAGATIKNKLGVYISGYEGRQRNAWQTYSDYDKSSVSIRMDYALSEKTKLTATFSGHAYDSDMAGSVDSTAYYNRQYSSTTDFTYRTVHSQRTRFTTTHAWNESNETSLTIAYRDNTIGQIPNYGIRWIAGSPVATVERNANNSTSQVAALQHRLNFNFLDAKLLTGAVIDMSPVNYQAHRIHLAAHLRPDGNTVERYTIVEERPDQFLARYEARLKNQAAYSQFEINPVTRLKVTLGIRYDKMAFDYDNHLDQSRGTKAFGQFTPRVGATFDLLRDKGLYANYSEGFSPPGLTAIFRKRADALPGNEFHYNLEPARFTNFEIGGWGAFFDSKLYVDVALYRMLGRRELLSIRQPDNSTEQQSAGKTLHQGIEYGLTWTPASAWFIRFGGTNAIHRFEEFELSQRSNDVRHVNGNDMPQSPGWIANTEVTCKPAYLKGFRIALEWQRISSWYQDQVNHVKYDDKSFLGLRGVSYLNMRIGYEWKFVEVFFNTLNLTNERYAHAATRGNAPTDRTSFTPAAPRTFVFGVQYTFAKKTETQ